MGQELLFQSIFSVKKSITLSSFPVLVAIVTCLFLMMSETVEARGVLIDERHIERQVKRILDIQERAKKNKEDCPDGMFRCSPIECIDPEWDNGSIFCDNIHQCKTSNKDESKKICKPKEGKGQRQRQRRE
ncbi:uncharacterized protein LOC142335445 isoform X2 [Convolutriloba macropyga]|uniref:uncharacterized protein LOC142335445 isoform X2 n=1 Tax=Convolutriloba macropyga TaxID=536237 RepID=UPI003F521855